MIETKQQPRTEDGKIQASKWKVLNFMRDGRCIVSTHFFHTEEECVAGIRTLVCDIHTMLQNNKPHTKIHPLGMRGHTKFLACEYSHSIPVPIEP